MHSCALHHSCCGVTHREGLQIHLESHLKTLQSSGFSVGIHLCKNVPCCSIHNGILARSGIRNCHNRCLCCCILLCLWQCKVCHVGAL